MKQNLQHIAPVPQSLPRATSGTGAARLPHRPGPAPQRAAQSAQAACLTPSPTRSAAGSRATVPVGSAPAPSARGNTIAIGPSPTLSHSDRDRAEANAPNGAHSQPDTTWPRKPNQPEARPLVSYRTTDRTEVAEDGRVYTLLSGAAECPHAISWREEWVEIATGEMQDVGHGWKGPCDRWTCEVCGPRKLRRQVGHYVRLFASLDAPQFVTLTLDPKTGLDPERSRKFLVDRFARWRKRINRRVKQHDCRASLTYVAAVEFQKRTQLAHLHAIIDAPGITAEQIGDQWFQCGGGAVCDVQPLGSGDEIAQKVGYSLGYALKDALHSPVKGRRYVLASQGDGFYTEAAQQQRAAYVEARRAKEGLPPRVNERDEEREFCTVWIPEQENQSRGNPDALTDEDRAHFAELQERCRTTQFRWKEPATGTWWRITQDASGRRRERLPSTYTSLVDSRLRRAQESTIRRAEHEAAQLTQERAANRARAILLTPPGLN